MNICAYEIRQVDAYQYDDQWVWNTSCQMGELKTQGDAKRAFVRHLHKQGISFKKNRTRIEFDGDVYEITDRKTGEPLFAAIPLF